MDLSKIREELRLYYEASKEAKHKMYLLIAFTSLTSVFLVISGLRSFRISRFVFVVILIIIAAIYYYKGLKPEIDAYKNKVKNTVFPLIFKEYFENVNYQPKHGYSEALMRQYAIIDLGQDYETEDFLEGEYKGVKFSRADIHTSTTTTTTVGNTTTTTTTVYFHGQVYQFDFHKSVDAYIRIREKGGFFSSTFGKGENVFGSRKFKLEDQLFNEKYHAVTNDEQYAFYVFTPQFMERVNKLAYISKGHIGLVISGETLYVSIYSNEDSLEFNDGHEVDLELVRQLESETQIIKHCIDELGLDSDLFRDRG